MKPRGGEEEEKAKKVEDGRGKKKRRAIHVKAAAATTNLFARVSCATQKAVTESHDARELIQKLAEERKRRKRREHAPRREEKGEPVPTEVSSKLTGPWLLWASECLARGPGFRYPGKPPQQERSSGGGNKKVSLERT